MTNIGEGDHLGLAEIETLEARPGQADDRRRRSRPTGAAVLNADDPLVAAMAPHCPGSVIFFARDAEHAGPGRAPRPGGHAVFVRDGHDRPGRGRPRDALDRRSPQVALTHHGRVGFQVENALAATAAAWALRLPLDDDPRRAW